MFRGPWNTWKDVDLISRDTLWEHFTDMYQWDTCKYNNTIMKTAWKKVISSRFPDTMTNARKEAVKLAKDKNIIVSNDLSVLKPFNPEWIRSDDWVKMVEVWNTDKWKTKSKAGKQNRSKMEHDSISKHCCGSIPVSHHKALLESKLKRPPTRLELFDKTHKSKKPKENDSNTDYVTPKNKIVVDSYMDGMMAKYGDEVDSHPPYDHEIWVEVTGGIKKGRVLGFGSVSDPHEFMVPSQASPSTTQEDNMEVCFLFFTI